MKTGGVNEVINIWGEVQRELHNCPNDCPFLFLFSIWNSCRTSWLSATPATASAFVHFTFSLNVEDRLTTALSAMPSWFPAATGAAQRAPHWNWAASAAWLARNPVRANVIKWRHNCYYREHSQQVVAQITQRPIALSALSGCRCCMPYLCQGCSSSLCGWSFACTFCTPSTQMSHKSWLSMQWACCLEIGKRPNGDRGLAIKRLCAAY